MILQISRRVKIMIRFFTEREKILNIIIFHWKWRLLSHLLKKLSYQLKELDKFQKYLIQDKKVTRHRFRDYKQDKVGR